MLDAVYGWMKNLAFYLVIMTAVLEVLPGNTYKKYIRFFTGLVLILLVVTPILNLTGTTGKFREEYRRQEEKLEAEIGLQKEKFESADVFEFLPEEYVGLKTEDEPPGEASEEERMETGRIKVEDIRIGENQELDMEADTFRE